MVSSVHCWLSVAVIVVHVQIAFSYEDNWSISTKDTDADGFVCVNSGIVIDGGSRCNGDPDCNDNSDEMNCTACYEAFHCTNESKCIAYDLKCNQVKDCDDNSDEEDCGNGDSQCKSVEFQCTNRECIPSENECNGQQDCTDNSDEHERCKTEPEPEPTSTAQPELPTTSPEPQTSSTTIAKPEPSTTSTTTPEPQTTTTAEPEPSTTSTTTPEPPTNTTAQPEPSTTSTTTPEPQTTTTAEPEPSTTSTTTPEPPTNTTAQPEPSTTSTTTPEPQTTTTAEPEPSTTSTTTPEPPTITTAQPEEPSTTSTTTPEPQTTTTADPEPSTTATTTPEPPTITTAQPEEPSTTSTTTPEPQTTTTAEPEPSTTSTTTPEPPTNTTAQPEPATTSTTTPEPVTTTTAEPAPPTTSTTTPEPQTTTTAEPSTTTTSSTETIFTTTAEPSTTSTATPETTIPSNACDSNQFQCGNGKCISTKLRCTGVNACPDGSDETNCPLCNDSFHCNNDQCISTRLRCDGKFDCEDKSDEYNCENKPTTPSKVLLKLKTYPNELSVQEGSDVVFQCRDESSRRASVRWIRPAGQPLPAGSQDFRGRLDLSNVQVKHEGEYICEAVRYPSFTPGAQISVKLQVEKKPGIPSMVCGRDEATCGNGDCIDKTKLCNGIPDCADGSDEIRCGPRCEPNEFECRSRDCVLKTWRCDGERDCEDGSDEENCEGNNGPCRSDEYQCANGQCILKSYQCDRVADCMDGTDELGCSKPTIANLPPPDVLKTPTDTFNISCRAVGVPVPLITWRLNWGHVPAKCTATSVNGLGVLTCRDLTVADSGAYSCESINSMGTVFGMPDTILTVKDEQSVCQPGQFNREARNSNECNGCFCFGATKQCASADLFTYRLRQRVTSLTVVGVVGPFNGERNVRVTDFKQSDLFATLHGVQMRLSNVQIGSEFPYYAMPADFHGNQLNSYGGFFRYEVEFNGGGRPINSPDLILIGKHHTLTHSSSGRFVSGVRSNVSVKFVPGFWRHTDGRLAGREDLMMTLASVEQILIRLLYTDRTQREVEVLRIEMDSAIRNNSGHGSATLVEKCRCPAGYTSLSCESCDHGYVRQQTGPWLGRCEPVVIKQCQKGTYADPTKGGTCQQCPCPRAVGQNFAKTCALTSDGVLRCNCQPGYTGKRCHKCAAGYVGKPLAVGGRCEPDRLPVSRCDKRGTQNETADGQCVCKPFVTGPQCNQCRPDAFHLNELSPDGCVECFCMGVSKKCSSSHWYRDTLRAHPERKDFALVDRIYEPEVVQNLQLVFGRSEVSVQFLPGDDMETYWWKLPAIFTGNQLTAYGGHLNYTVSFTTPPGGQQSPDNGPDVVIRSNNEYTLMYYRPEDDEPRSGVPNTYSVLIHEDQWSQGVNDPVQREHLLMALADVRDILVKATYTTITERAALQAVSLETATENGTRDVKPRAIEVEHCVCPEGFSGLSCERCAPGYGRDPDWGDGMYLGLCHRCRCNGHADTCDVETGICRDCRHNTMGAFCEQCAAGFVGNATVGTEHDCRQTEDRRGCDQCNAAGTVSCDPNGRCMCKTNVVGERCDQCRYGAFDLSEDNRNGCTECFCSGVTHSCASSQLYRRQMPISPFEASDIPMLVNERGVVLANQTGIDVDLENNRYSHHLLVDAVRSLYWRLPDRFSGNQLLSYGGRLQFTVSDLAQGPFVNDRDVLIVGGNGQTLSWRRNDPEQYATSVRLVESEWSNGDRPVSREHLMTVLSDVRSILIRATLRQHVGVVYIGDISLDTAVTQSGGVRAGEVEECDCPVGYRGTSCESCNQFFYRDINDTRAGVLGSCKRCPCSEENTASCHLTKNKQVQCECKPGYYGKLCDNDADGLAHAPRITLQPRVQTTEYQPANVTCKANGSLPIQYYWEWMSGDISQLIGVQVKDNVLQFLNTQRNHQGKYRCTARNKFGDHSKIVQVFVRPAPHPVVPTTTVAPPAPLWISAHIAPATLNGRQGDDLRLTCLTQPGVSIVWTKGNLALPPNAHADHETLVIQEARIDDTGTYRCVVQAPGLQPFTAEADVYVQAHDRPWHGMPQVQNLLPRYTVGQGDNVDLPCVFLGGDASSSVRWSKQHGDFLPNVRQHENTLRLSAVQMDNRGTYVCKIVTQYGDSEASTELEVEPRQPPILFIHPNEPQTIIAGEGLQLDCRATAGDPTPIVTWQRRDRQPMSDRIEHNGEGVLRSVSLELADGGEYVCTAENLAGSVSSSVLVTVHERPNVTIVPGGGADLRLTEGDELRLECIVTGWPTPSVQWLKQEPSGDGSATIWRPMGEKALLQRERVSRKDEAVYMCTAKNEAGDEMQYVRVLVEAHKRDDFDQHVKRNLDQIIVNPRSVVEQYEPFEFSIGDRAELECNIDNSNVQRWWSRADGRQLSRHARQVNDVLIIEYMRAEDAGVYVCHENRPNGQSNVILKMKIVVKEIPKISFSPSMTMKHNVIDKPIISARHVINVGASVTMRCLYDPVPYGMQFNWKREERHSLSLSSENVLTLHNVRENDAGRYVCTMSMPSRKESKTIVNVVVNHHHHSPSNLAKQRPARQYRFENRSNHPNAVLGG